MEFELAVLAISADENIRAGRRFHFAIVDYPSGLFVTFNRNADKSLKKHILASLN